MPSAGRLGVTGQSPARRALPLASGGGAALGAAAKGFGSPSEEAATVPVEVGGHESLVAWSAAEGIELGGWEAGKVPGKGYRGAVATRDIPPKSLLCRVPAKTAWMDSDTPGIVTPKLVAKKYWSTQGITDGGAKAAFLRLAVRLLWEKRLGAKSRWAAYIANLPDAEAFEGLATRWEDEELEQLQWPPLVSQIALEREWLRKQHVQLCKNVAKKVPPVSLDEFRWCVETVRSRTFTCAGRHLLCPIADMFNHDTEERGSSFEFNEELGAYELHSGELPVEAGGEALIRYGGLSNNDLLAFYGFSVLGNRWDSLLVPADALEAYAAPKAAEGCGGVLEALRKFQYVGRDGAMLRLCSGEPGAETMKLLRALALDSPLLESQSETALAMQIGEEVAMPQGVDEGALRLLSGFCQGQLEAFPTSIEEDERELGDMGGGGGGRRGDWLRFRLTKKRILQSLVAA